MRTLNLVKTAAVISALRRLAHRTGVTDDEAFGSLPGDEVIPRPMFEYNRGLTIAATPAEIWPWLVQMGYGRAGWYTPETLDRWANRWLWRLEDKYPYRASPWQLLPDHQQIAVGDVIADGPQFAAYFRVLAVEPAQHLVLYSLRHPWRGKPVNPAEETALQAREADLRDGGVFLEFSWAFVLRPVAKARTRLVIRARNNVSPRLVRVIAEVPVGLVDAYEAMGMLYGIRNRVLATRRTSPVP